MSNNKQKVYNRVNICILLFSAMWFVYAYRNVQELFIEQLNASLIVLFFSVVLVHVLKSFRLYFILFGNRISLKNYWKQYCKVTPISMIFPFKIGELFRMYCYGYQIENYFRGILIVLMDRFMDTIALITVMFVGGMGNAKQMSELLLVFFVFLIGCVGFYWSFPNIYQFWLRYLLHAKATNNKNRMLEIINIANEIYGELEKVLKGKGIILYMLSLGAWLVEIGSLLLIDYMTNGRIEDTTVADYLNAALGGQNFEPLQRFVCVSIVVLVSVYLILRVYEVKHLRKKGN